MRISKFLRQTCTLERVRYDSLGNALMNDYGELTYSTAITIKCRRERLIKDIETINGAIVQTMHNFYTDVLIGINDKLDSEVVLTTEDYVNGSGKIEGYRSIT